MLSKFWIAPLCAVLASLAATAASPQVLYANPPGSYLDACDQVVNSGIQLKARCRTHDARWVETQLRHVFQCVGDISNNDGVLVCDRGWSMNGGPVGSYEKTCLDIHRVDGRLYATCKRWLGAWVPTWINATCAGEISNEDGVLTCNPPKS